MSQPTGRAYLRMNDGLYVGQAVQVRWTNCHRFFAAPGEVVTINPKTVIVVLTDAIVDQYEGRILYPVGQRIKVPRFLTPGWSANNTVAPLEH